MPDFTNAKIYEIISPSSGARYIGATTTPNINYRMKKHLYDYNKFNNHNGPFITSFSVLDHGDANINILEYVNCTNNYDLHEREKYYIMHLANVINKNIPNRKIQEYYRDNIDNLHEYKNKKNDCVCGGKYTTANHSIHRKSKKHINFINN